MRLCRLNSTVFQAEFRYIMREKLQTELIQVTVLRIKSFSESALNNLTELYIIILIDRESDVITAVER
ncbi:hypothetical protein EMPG_09231, partial [Blastomyces silverae]